METAKGERPVKNGYLSWDLFLVFGGSGVLALTTVPAFQAKLGSPNNVLATGVMCLVMMALGVVALAQDLKVVDLSPLLKAFKARSLKKNERAIVPAIVYACIGIAVTIIAWVPLGYVCYDIVDTFVSNFHYPAAALGTIALVEWVIAWTPAVIIVGLLIMVIVQAFRTEYPSAPIGM